MNALVVRSRPRRFRPCREAREWLATQRATVAAVSSAVAPAEAQAARAVGYDVVNGEAVTTYAFRVSVSGRAWRGSSNPVDSELTNAENWQ